MFYLKMCTIQLLRIEISNLILCNKCNFIYFFPSVVSNFLHWISQPGDTTKRKDIEFLNAHLIKFRIPETWIKWKTNCPTARNFLRKIWKSEVFRQVRLHVPFNIWIRLYIEELPKLILSPPYPPYCWADEVSLVYLPFLLESDFSFWDFH